MELGAMFLNNEFLHTYRLALNTLPLANWALEAGLADIPECLCSGSSLEETALHAFYYCEQVCPF